MGMLHKLWRILLSGCVWAWSYLLISLRNCVPARAAFGRGRGELGVSLQCHPAGGPCGALPPKVGRVQRCCWPVWGTVEAWGWRAVALHILMCTWLCTCQQCQNVDEIGPCAEIEAACAAATNTQAGVSPNVPSPLLASHPPGRHARSAGHGQRQPVACARRRWRICAAAAAKARGQQHRRRRRGRGSSSGVGAGRVCGGGPPHAGRAGRGAGRGGGAGGGGRAGCGAQGGGGGGAGGCDGAAVERGGGHWVLVGAAMPFGHRCPPSW